jgi:hypothetical protein
LWAVWAAPCPIRDEEMSLRKVRSHRKSRMDQRTRERLPVLSVLVTTVDHTAGRHSNGWSSRSAPRLVNCSPLAA